MLTLQEANDIFQILRMSRWASDVFVSGAAKRPTVIARTGSVARVDPLVVMRAAARKQREVDERSLRRMLRKEGKSQSQI